MKDVPQILLLAALICLSSISRAAAEPVTIVSGSLLSTGLFEVSPPSTLRGTRGLTITTSVAVGPGSGRLDALEVCRFQPDCLPGYRLSVGGWLAPNDSGLVGTVVTFRGVEYRNFGMDDPFGFHLELAGSVRLPEFGDMRPRTVTAPFALTGRFTDPDRGVDVRLAGRGTATLWLRPESSFVIGEPGWSVDRLRYDFDPSAPVPEPATLLLFGTGAAAAFCARRRRPDHTAGADKVELQQH